MLPGPPFSPDPDPPGFKANMQETGKKSSAPKATTTDGETGDRAIGKATRRSVLP